MQHVARGAGTAIAGAAVALALPAAAMGGTASTTRAAAASDGATTLRLVASAPGMKALRARGVQISARRPATASRRRLVLPVAQLQVGAAARLDHRGKLVLRAGRRKLTLHSLRTSLADQPRITALAGRSRVTVFMLRGQPELDATAGSASALGMRLSLAPRGAAFLRDRLRLRRLPAGRLGTADVSARAAATVLPPVPAPAPAPQPPGVGDDTPPPPPAIGHTDWIASALPGVMDLKSFIDYLHQPWPAVPPATESGPGRIEATDGAARIDPANRYDYRVDVVATERDAGGVVTIAHRGRLAYLLPAHSIDSRIADPEIVLDAGGATGRLLADGQYTSRSSAGAAPQQFTDEHLLDLDLTGIHPELGAGGTRTWSDVPAVVAASGEEELGYEPGTAWGTFTITVPAADTQPGPAAVTGDSTFAMRPSWLTYIEMVPPAGTIETGDGTARDGGTFTAALTGTYERGSRTGVVDLPGYVRYLKPAHGIDIAIRDPRVTIAGADSTLSAEVTAGGTDQGRVTIATLDLSEPVETPESVTWTDALASFTAAGAAVFAYEEGDEYGHLTIALGAD